MVNLGSLFPVSLLGLHNPTVLPVTATSEFKSTTSVVGPGVFQSFETELPSCPFLREYPMKGVFKHKIISDKARRNKVRQSRNQQPLQTRHQHPLCPGWEVSSGLLSKGGSLYTGE